MSENNPNQMPEQIPQNPVPEPPVQVPNKSGLTIAGFACSLISMIINPIAIISILGLIFSAVGRSTDKRNGAPTGMATWGIVLGVLGTIFFVVQFLTIMNSTFTITFS